MISIVRPGGPFQHAPLLVEREELDVDVAAAAKYPMAQPHHFPRVTHYHVRVYDRRAVLWIGATNKTDHGRNEPLLAIDIKTSILMIRVHENISSYLSFLYHFRSTCRFSSTTAISFFYRQNHRLLVVENRVRPPDAIVRNTNHSDPRELRGVPFQVMVRPNLCHPAIGRQYLILLVLRTKNRQDLSRKIP